jgi:hypothetical protein
MIFHLKRSNDPLGTNTEYASDSINGAIPQKYPPGHRSPAVRTQLCQQARTTIS